MKVVDRQIQISNHPKCINPCGEDRLSRIEIEPCLTEYHLSIDRSFNDRTLILKWRKPAINVKGVWTPNTLMDRRIRADWEDVFLKSRLSIDAPLFTVFGHDDSNTMTISCLNLIDEIHVEANIQEEDNHIHFTISLDLQLIRENIQSLVFRFDMRSDQYSTIIQKHAHWMASHGELKPTHVPLAAKVPLYSTWYSYHQDLSISSLLEECKLSKTLGYELIIIDDGWQTLDDNRGYDYTGDWNPDRIVDMSGFVQQVHKLGMKLMLWYSVPFCGVKSDAYQEFKGKFLTENHHWAPVFDPRFPEVRNYLVGKYVNAMLDWHIDGFKLDFIDDFKVYPETELHELEGRDTINVNEGVSFLIKEIASALQAINPDVLIEFRQQYISPALRHLGNMFRAFDCPNDAVMNRVRTTDVKLLCGESAVHSDMFTWHNDESTEIAALQITNILFSVPQISVRLANQSQDKIEMIKFLTGYWREHKHILLDGDFMAHKPCTNYTILEASADNHKIIGLYDDHVIQIDDMDKIDIINSKITQAVFLDFSQVIKSYTLSVLDCKGKLNDSIEISQNEGIQKIKVPTAGIIKIR